MNRKEPDYVAGAKGRYTVQPPIEHPARCLCSYCKTHRAPNERDRPVVYRTIRRKSPTPDNRVKSAQFALKVQEEETQRLRDAVRIAEEQQAATPGQPTLAEICEHYERFLREHAPNTVRDHYRLRVILAFFGASRDPRSITKQDLAAFIEHLRSDRKCGKATQLRYINTILALLNRAVKQDRILHHQLRNVDKPRVRKTTKPVIFSRDQIAVLLGPAMEEFEAEQREALHRYDPATMRHQPSVVPLRGFVLVAYYTLMRPANNFALRWEQIHLPDSGPARFRLDEHKNSSKGVEVEGALHPEVVAYLHSLAPDAAQRRGFVHPNPATGRPYRNITMHWKRLVAIANTMLPHDQQLKDQRAHFYTLRHSGASHLAAVAGNPVVVARLMGDTQLTTVLKFYFDSSIDDMAAAMDGWKVVNESGRESDGEQRGSAGGGNSL